jgi:hypothetical protein
MQVGMFFLGVLLGCFGCIGRMFWVMEVNLLGFHVGMAVTLALAFSCVQHMLADNNFVRGSSSCETMAAATAICRWVGDAINVTFQRYLVEDVLEQAVFSERG